MDRIAVAASVSRRPDRVRRRRFGGHRMAAICNRCASAEERERGARAVDSHGQKGKNTCEKLARQAGWIRGIRRLQRWQASRNKPKVTVKLVELYAKLVQPPVLDKPGGAKSRRSAAESTLMIAVSPLALVDMAFYRPAATSV